MKVICIEDRVYDVTANRYSQKVSRSLTKGRVYSVLKKEKIRGLLHYWIINDIGMHNYYYFTRFQTKVSNKLKII